MQTGQTQLCSKSWSCRQWGTRALCSEENKKKCKWTGTILKVSGCSFHLAPKRATYLKLQNSLLQRRGWKRSLHSGVTGDKSAPQNKCPNRPQGKGECKTHPCLDTICQDIKNAIPGTKRSIINSRTCQAQGFWNPGSERPGRKELTRWEMCFLPQMVTA